MKENKYVCTVSLLHFLFPLEGHTKSEEERSKSEENAQFTGVRRILMRQLLYTGSGGTGWGNGGGGTLVYFRACLERAVTEVLRAIVIIRPALQGDV